jgi:hypothetical protein
MKAARLVAAGSVIVAAVVAITLQLSLAQGNLVQPLLNCVRYDFQANELTAFFGYASSFPGTVTIPITDDNNFFTPGVTFRNQPSDFLSGVHDHQFSTSFVVSSSTPEVTWFLNGNTVSARNDSAMYCNPALAGPEGVPGPAGPTGPPGIPGPTDLFAASTLRRVTAERTGAALAACKANESLVSGGGSCDSTLPGMRTSAPSGNGWMVACVPSSVKATAVAFCALKP